MSNYDAWLTNDPGSLADAENEAFETWAEENLPTLDWNDRDAVDAAFAGPWKDFVRDLEDAAQSEIDRFEEWYEMERLEA